MRILINEQNEIIGYSIVGSLDGDFEINDDILPSGFKDDFAPRRFIYSKGVVSYNQSYTSRTQEVMQPNYEQRISELERQMKDVQAFINNQPQA